MSGTGWARCWMPTTSTGASWSTHCAYLDCWADYLQTARALDINTSTARYRVYYVRQILAVDLTDSNSRFNLQAAARLLDYVDGHQPPAGDRRPLPAGSARGYGDVRRAGH